MFGYLKSKHNAEMVFDPTVPNIDKSQFPRQEWGHSPYSGMKEQLPPKMKKPRGFGFIISAYVDSDHAGDSVTRRSRTGFIIFLNNAPIYWLSKKHERWSSPPRSATIVGKAVDTMVWSKDASSKSTATDPITNRMDWLGGAGVGFCIANTAVTTTPWLVALCGACLMQVAFIYFVADATYLNSASCGGGSSLGLTGVGI